MLFKGLIAAIVALALTLPVALAAGPVQVAPGQRVDLKVLLMSADGTEPEYAAWKAALDREGVPYDTFVAYNGQARAATLTDEQLADYGANHARYQAIILTNGDLGHSVTNAGGTASFLSALSDGEWATLAKFEKTFGIRQLSNYTAPSRAHGLELVSAGSQDGQVGQLTAAGRAAFPYLKGPVQIANDDPVGSDAWGYPAKATEPGNFQTLLSGPGDTVYLGVYTHPEDGREEMVLTVAANQFQNHAQLLRHGMLNWVTRGVFLGFQRNYLELQVDDLFLGDDAWDPVTHSTNYGPGTASRMTPADVDRAIAWSRAHGVRLDMAYNGGGSTLQQQETGQDALATKFNDAAVRNSFGWINHTLDHPNLDCSTSSFITRQITDNVAWANARQLPLANAAEVVTGEHSGLANSRPGNPGTIDPPSFNGVTPEATGGTLAGGLYDYALTARSATGETIGSEVESVDAGAVGTLTNSATITFNAVCHAVGYDVYRRPAGTAAWARVATLARAADAPTDDGTNPIVLSVRDTGAAGTAASPPTVNGATLAPYGQNPNLMAALTAAGIKTIATDASKGYPTTPTVITSALSLPGALFSQGAVRAVPRYPSNIYYNVSRQGQQLDEYNWIYVAPANGGGCVPIANVTTCRTTLATWGEYVASETNIMFRHIADNDPRPHYFHQSNLADYNPALPETDPNQGGILYPVIGTLLARYEAGFDRNNSPLVQLTSTQIADTMARADAWNAAKGSVSAWLQDGRVYVSNGGSGAMQVPLTGTTLGDSYGGQRSGWTTLAPGAQVDFAPSDPASTGAPALSGTARVGESVSSTTGTWSGTADIGFTRQWQRCDKGGANCANIAGANGSSLALTDADEGRTVRVAVTAGNWISSVSLAFSAPSGVVAAKPATRRSDDARRGVSESGRSGAPRPKLRLTKLSMSPRKFAVSHKRLPKGTKLDGTRVSWKLNRAAKVRLTFQRKTRHGYKTVGRITRSAKAGTNVVRFRGRFGKKLLKPQRYRLVISASGSGDRTAARRLAFRVVQG